MSKEFFLFLENCGRKEEELRMIETKKCCMEDTFSSLIIFAARMIYCSISLIPFHISPTSLHITFNLMWKNFFLSSAAHFLSTYTHTYRSESCSGSRSDGYKIDVEWGFWNKDEISKFYEYFAIVNEVKVEKEGKMSY